MRRVWLAGPNTQARDMPQPGAGATAPQPDDGGPVSHCLRICSHSPFRTRQNNITNCMLFACASSSHGCVTCTKSSVSREWLSWALQQLQQQTTSNPGAQQCRGHALQNQLLLTAHHCCLCTTPTFRTARDCNLFVAAPVQDGPSQAGPQPAGHASDAAAAAPGRARHPGQWPGAMPRRRPHAPRL